MSAIRGLLPYMLRFRARVKKRLLRFAKSSVPASGGPIVYNTVKVESSNLDYSGRRRTVPTGADTSRCGCCCLVIVALENTVCTSHLARCSCELVRALTNICVGIEQPGSVSRRAASSHSRRAPLSCELGRTGVLG